MKFNLVYKLKKSNIFVLISKGTQLNLSTTLYLLYHVMHEYICQCVIVYFLFS